MQNAISTTRCLQVQGVAIRLSHCRLDPHCLLDPRLPLANWHNCRQTHHKNTGVRFPAAPLDNGLPLPLAAAVPGRLLAAAAAVDGRTAAILSSLLPTTAVCGRMPAAPAAAFVTPPAGCCCCCCWPGLPRAWAPPPPPLLLLPPPPLKDASCIASNALSAPPAAGPLLCTELIRRLLLTKSATNSPSGPGDNTSVDTPPSPAPTGMIPKMPLTMPPPALPAAPPAAAVTCGLLALAPMLFPAPRETPSRPAF